MNALIHERETPMIPAWKRWLGASALLVVLGAGCFSGGGPADAPDPEGGSGLTDGERPDDGRMEVDPEGQPMSLDVEADALLTLMLADADADTAAESEEDADADVLTRGDDKEALDAYGRSHEEPAP